MSSEMNSLNSKKTHEYDEVVISLENCILNKNILENTISRRDGLSFEYERYLRFFCCELIKVSGILLNLPPVASATAQVLFQRFFYFKSFIKNDYEVYSMAALFLAAKIEEYPRRARDVVNVFRYLKQKRLNREILPMEYFCDDYVILKAELIKAERRILKQLGFCVHVQHPYKMIISILNILDRIDSQKLVQKAWNLMNDCLRGDTFVRFSSIHIGCACIVLASRIVKINLPDNPHWWRLFDINERLLLEICSSIVCLYNIEPIPLQNIDAFLENKRRESHIIPTTLSIENCVRPDISQLTIPKDSNLIPQTQENNTIREEQIQPKNHDSSCKYRDPNLIKTHKSSVVNQSKCREPSRLEEHQSGRTSPSRFRSQHTKSTHSRNKQTSESRRSISIDRSHPSKIKKNN